MQGGLPDCLPACPQTRTAGEDCGLPVLQHLGDLHGELAVEEVCEDVLYPAVLKQVLHKERERDTEV